MAFTTTVEPIDRDIEVILQDNLSPKARSAALAEEAKIALADAKAQNEQALGAVPPYDTYVDGSEGKSEDQVSPDGEIVYQFRLVTDALSWIDAELIAHSPVKTGRYQRSHILLADGEITDPDAPTLASEYVFLNTQPYARKIERGESTAAPEGVYEGIAALAAARFGNTAKIGFAYRSAADVGGEWAAGASAARHARRHHRVSDPANWLTRQPAIVIGAL